MKIILQENIRYASLITKALEFCELCLARSTYLFPFAVVSIENDIQSVFIEDDSLHGPSKMIEQLEEQIALRICQAENAIGILIYAVTVVTPENEQSDALMLSITDSNGSNTMTIYPYTVLINSISVGKPYTCDFSS